MLTSENSLTADDLLFMVDGLALCAPALADDPGQLCVEIRQVITEAHSVTATHDLVVLQSSLCIAQSLLMLKRPAEALAVIHSAARHCASHGN
jgi:hypothetical protein